MPKSVPIGTIQISEAAKSALTDGEVLAAISCQLRGDWGDAPAEDWEANDKELQNCNRVCGVHRTASGDIFWVVTDLTRRSTIVALPSDYE